MNRQRKKGSRTKKIILSLTGILLVVAIAGYFIANTIFRRKLEDAVRGLPPKVNMRYGSLRTNVFTGFVEMKDVDIRYMPASSTDTTTPAGRLSIQTLSVSGISVIGWLRSHRLRIQHILVAGAAIQLDDAQLEKDSTLRQFQPPQVDALIDRIECRDISVEGTRKGTTEFTAKADGELDSVSRDGPAGSQLSLSRAQFFPPGADERIDCDSLEADSRKGTVRVGVLKIRPTLGQEEVGRSKGHQVDVVRADIRAIHVTAIDWRGLMKHRLEAGRIEIGGSTVHVFRDRRLPIKEGDKAMPMQDLEALPVELRVGQVRLGKTRFEYEEFPKEGEKTGALVIEDFHGVIEPLVNKPRSGDPDFITMTTTGSLMGSGTVTATTRMPLHPAAAYQVDGAFHDLDVTRLNNPAENLGQLRLESGMLNSLVFHFEMGEERSTGKIVGEYHNLVADKLKEKNGKLKVAGLKSFALKKLIIPKNKDKSLPVSKRTGKVDYKRDKSRYFSYYLLHSLLVGVKSSFSLGFLLPG